MDKNKKKLAIISTASIAVLVLVLGINFSNLANFFVLNRPKAEVSSLRGQAGDLWADLIVGKRDFTEISPKEITAKKVFAPGGVIIDKYSIPQKGYVWDSGNNRILGLNIDECFASSSPCEAQLVIGQPSLSDHGACNLDSSFQNYPNRAPASASTICAVKESTHTVLEDKSFSSMYVDAASNLYVADFQNHRVLKYINPFTTDTVADEVWGHTDFSENRCNNGGSPTATTLCFQSLDASGGGVVLDSAGNLWVADGGNNRVVRYPKNTTTGVISKTADVVLGQSNFTTGGDWSFGEELNKFKGPAAVAFDSTGKLLVADSSNNRVLIFDTPNISGSTGKLFSTQIQFNYPTDVRIDSAIDGILIYDTVNWDARITLWNGDGTLKNELPHLGNRGGGSVGVDKDGNLLASSYVYGQDVHKFTKQVDGTYLQNKNLFSPPSGVNKTSERRFEIPGWTGVAVAADQLFVADGRIQFFNNPLSVTNGQTPDGVIGNTSALTIPDPGYEQLKSDASNRIWASKRDSISVFQAPVINQAMPDVIITSPINVLGGGQVVLNDIHGIAPSPDGSYLWVSEAANHRVFRISNPLRAPVIDVVLGQKDLATNQCNQGVISAPNQNPGRSADQDARLDMLCYPGTLSLDKLGNLFVSDHYLEVEGNWRMLMFKASLFPASLSSVIYAPVATKEFPRSSSVNPYNHMTFEPAFDSTNRMVVGLNPYSGKRFVEFYNNPTRFNSANPSDYTYAIPDGQLKDFSGWPVGATFDANDNLYIMDANRGRVLIYKTPFKTPVTPTSTVTATPIPTQLPLPTNTPTPVPTTSAFKVISSADDAEERVSNKSVNISDSDLELGADGSNAQVVGLRFQNVTVPKGAVIKNAYVEFLVDESKSAATNISIFGQATDNAAIFTTSSGNISSRAATQSMVSWNNIPAWTTIDSVQKTPDISSIITEITSRTNWASNNSLVLTLKGTGIRTARSYNTSSTKAPRLVVTYEQPGVVTTPVSTPTPTSSTTPSPTTTITPTTTSAPGATVTLTPTADTYVQSGSPTVNSGTKTSFNVVGSPAMITYIKFDLTSVAGKTITSSKLKLKVNNDSTNVQTIKYIADTSWNETTLNYNNQPSLASAVVINNFTPSTNGMIVEIDLTTFIQNNKGKVITLIIDSTGTNTSGYNSREASSDKPTLVIN